MFPSIRYRQTDMLVHPQFDPVVFTLGPLSVRWYGVMYLLGFAAFWCLGRLRAKEAWRGITPEDVEDLLFYGVFGVVLGGRLGYCLFYQPGYYLSHPGEIFALWHGGMSAHGGLLGVIFVMILLPGERKSRSSRSRTSWRRSCRSVSWRAASEISSTESFWGASRFPRSSLGDGLPSGG